MMLATTLITPKLGNMLGSAPLLAPWHLALRWLAWASGLLLSGLCWMGITPAGFVPQATVRELNGIISHMHLREDQYREALRQQQEALDAKEGDKKKALRSLKKTRMELDSLAEELAQMHESGGVDGQHGAAGGGPYSRHRQQPGQGQQPGQKLLSRLGLHLSMAALLASVWWFYLQDFPAIQRKLVFTFLFPLGWLYVNSLLTHKHAPTQLYSACWFLAGFVAAHKFPMC